LLGGLRPGEERWPPRGGPVQSPRGLITADEVVLECFGAAGRSHPALEAAGLEGRGPDAFGRRDVLWAREAQGGSRTRGVDGEDLKGEESHKSIGRQVGATRVGRERIREGRDASKSVKLAE
jgi:hypothetical protein